MGFKDYCNNQKSNQDSQKQSFQNASSDANDNVEKLYNQYKDKSEQELLGELFKNVEKQKNDGTFNYNSLLQTINKVAPFLSKEQNLKLKELMQKIK